MDAIVWRGIERLLIVFSAALLSYIGYKLFTKGIESHNKVDFKTSFGKLVISGTGPGLSFMIFGALVLIYALKNGGAMVSNINPNGSSQQNVELLKSPSPSASTEIIQNNAQILDRLAAIEKNQTALFKLIKQSNQQILAIEAPQRPRNE
jgi:hypothetical protein